MINMLKRLSVSSWYWVLVILIGIGFESVALYYQYGLDYGPCPLCIHVRVGVAGFVLVSVLALLLQNVAWWRFSHVLNAVILAWLSERAYLLLGTERGFVFIECGVDSGLPSWLALDHWVPLLFEVKESCGYTPKLLFGISMAEALIILFPLMLLASVVLLALSFFAARGQD